MRRTIDTSVGALRLHGTKIRTSVDQDKNRGSLEASLSSKGSKTDVDSRWGNSFGDSKSTDTYVRDEDSRANLKLEFHRRNGNGTLSIKNPGRGGSSSSLSIPLGDVSQTRDNYFSKGFFPESGVSEVKVDSEKDGEEQYTEIEFRHGEDTLPQVYRVSNGIIHEVTYDAGFQSYHDFYGKRDG